VWQGLSALADLALFISNPNPELLVEAIGCGVIFAFDCHNLGDDICRYENCSGSHFACALPCRALWRCEPAVCSFLSLIVSDSEIVVLLCASASLLVFCRFYITDHRLEVHDGFKVGLDYR